MYTFNQVQLLGRLGKDPKISRKSKALASFSVATHLTWKNTAGEKEVRTEWHRVVCYNGLVDILEKYLKKGDPVFIQGRLQTREWQDDRGSKHLITEVIASEVLKLAFNVTASMENAANDDINQPF